MDARNVRLKRKVTHSDPLTPKQQAVRLGVAVVAMLVLFVIGVKWYNENRNISLNSSSDLESRGLYLKLSMHKSSYAEGEPVDIQLLVRNISEKPVTLDFEHNLEFDITVQNELDLLFTQIPRNIWQYSHKYTPVAKAHSITISPGKEQVFRGSWDQRNFDGTQVKPGRYIITGYLKAKNHEERLQLRGQTQN
jgi:hypothetical protein